MPRQGELFAAARGYASSSIDSQPRGIGTVKFFRDLFFLFAKFATCEYDKLMRVITKAHIKRAREEYPDAEKALLSWYQIMSSTQFNNFAELKRVFKSIDKVGRVVVFNIKGNHYRLVAAIHYNTKLVYVLEVMTHVEYDKDKWKDKYRIYD